MISDLVAGVFLVAVIYLLVRNKNGTAFVTAFSDMLSALIGQATDIASTSSSSGTTTTGN